MPNAVDQFIADGLDAGATYLETEKAAIVAKAVPPVDTGLDSLANTLTTAVNNIHGVAGAFIDPLVDKFIASLDAEGKAAAPTTLDGVIDAVAAFGHAEATKLRAA